VNKPCVVESLINGSSGMHVRVKEKDRINKLKQNKEVEERERVRNPNGQLGQAT
jgi:predicted FMN-binding regulatory protein PaiB